MRETWNKLGWRRLSGHGGWGYNSNAMEDADSSIWCLRLVNSLGVGKLMRAQMATDFILRHKSEDGGFSTYTTDIFSVNSFLGDISGWIQTHTCITAAGAVLPQFNNLLCQYLIRNQLTDGLWKAYWWIDDSYVTAFSVDALLMNENKDYKKHYDKALEWIKNRFDDNGYIINEKLPNGSPFSTTLGLRIVSMPDKGIKEKEILKRGIQWLKSQQADDGSWESSAFMRVPPMNLKDPELFDYVDWNDDMDKNWGVITCDQHRLYTTTTVLYTLSLLL